MHTVNHDLVEIALERTSGSNFEYFFQAFYSALAGISFIPLGGNHDGGADAFQDDGLFENQNHKLGTFYQATTQTDHRSKIRHTVKRLRQFGREPKSVIYFTSHTISLIDKEEEELSTELDVVIKIRDRKWIAININRTPQTVAAFKTYLEPNLAFLSKLGGTFVESSPNVTAHTMCVFLGQEIDRRHGNTDLLEAVTDSLILWALEGTDPDAGNFMNRDEIRAKIENMLPSANHFIRKKFDHRIRLLASKANPIGREIRWYKKEDKFCLPHETREIVKKENTEDEFLKLQVMDTYKQRAREALDDDDSLSDEIAKVAHRALELTFEKEGLRLVQLLSETCDEDSYVAISDQVDQANEEVGLTGADSMKAKEVAITVLRQAFYSSTEEERIYYGKLSRTYTLMFTLRNEPKIVEYFKGMSSNFVLFVGSDIIVRALSERYLPAEDQMTTNMFRILREAGSTLVLTKMAVDEVQAHLAVTDHEFRNWFADLEHHVNLEIARHANKILIRAYFNAKFDPLLQKPPTNWGAFVEQICSYQRLHYDEEARIQVKEYLTEKFDFEYFDDEDLAEITNENEIQELAEKLKEIKHEDILAINDAKQILGVYGKRRKLGEYHKSNPYGFRTWWLTHETRVRKVTKDLVNAKGAQYIIRPEFILNFIALSPTTEQVRQSYNTIFPSLLGLRLSNRMREDIFHNVLRKVKKVQTVDEARAKTMMIQLSNDLKSNDFMHYESNLESES